MKTIYIVVKEGVYLTAIISVCSKENDAIAIAELAASQDKDDYHVYSVEEYEVDTGLTVDVAELYSGVEINKRCIGYARKNAEWTATA